MVLTSLRWGSRAASMVAFQAEYVFPLWAIRLVVAPCLHAARIVGAVDSETHWQLGRLQAFIVAPAAGSGGTDESVNLFIPWRPRCGREAWRASTRLAPLQL